MINPSKADIDVNGIPAVITAATQRNVRRIISVLGFVTLFLALFFGYLLFRLTGSREIMLGALAEAFLCGWALYLNYRHRTGPAIALSFFIHCLSTLYFGLILAPDTNVQTMAVFLLGITFLFFEGSKLRWLATAIIAAMIVAIEVNNRVVFMDKVPMSAYHEKLTGWMIIGTVMMLTSLMLYFFVNEITDYRKRVYHYNHYTEELKRTKYAISKYVQENSHQLRIDLNIVYGHLQHLLAKTAGKDSWEVVEVKIRDLHAMLNSTKATHEFINNSLEWARIERGLEAPIKREAFDLFRWLDNISERFRLMAQERPVELVFNTENLPLYLYEDKHKLGIIIGNLLSNAIKFTEKNSSVRFSAIMKNDQLVFEIKDQGKGIPPDQVHLVFEPFVTESGTGLGLPVARKLARALHGDIYIDPAAERGTTFVFSLPCKAASTEQVAELKSSGDFTLKGLRVLVVDDDYASRRIAALNLQRMDYIIYTCSTFAACRERLQKSPIDIILLDYNLAADVTAVDVLRWIRGCKLTRQIPVIVLSGDAYSHGGEDAKHLSLEAGANGYMTKPIQYDELAAEIGKIVDQAGIKMHL
ncbi:hybrid sensor histidine kinase/response regulator [Chitinophaga sp. YIM B06452]|uniref:hybrid sensor histidine kinase/response regulator n=1 Tax=Chitinophaga sp. YIM B06452 TaxID=3082158 RepID=UPI0031FE796E